MSFVGNPRQDMPKGIAYHLKDYCELIDTTGRCIREDKTGYIDSCHSPILECLGLVADQWLTLTTEFEKKFCYLIYPFYTPVSDDAHLVMSFHSEKHPPHQI
jgi:hypothetical protein